MNSKSIRQMTLLALSTGGSRILGLVRDVAFFSSFGTGLIASAFIIAFTIPNLFRRMLGEGALASAFLPIFSQCWHQNAASGFQLLNQTLTRLLLYFGGGTLIAILALLLIQHLPTLPANWALTLPMLAMLLPYAVMICLAAILTAALNVFGRFFLASLSPVLLNLAMIIALVVGGVFLPAGSQGLATALCAGVLVGGLLQLGLPAAQLCWHRWQPQVDLTPSPELTRLKHLFLTATGGAAILQINILVTRIIAYQHSDEAVSQLYLASRLTELPLGVFAVAIYTVLFPLLSSFAAANDARSFADACKRGILLCLGITLPAAVGLALLASPILSLLFQWGRFNASDVAQTAPVLAIYAMSIPCYALSSLLTRIFHSQQEMGPPVRVSAVALLLNGILSLTLMIPFGVLGLAAANVITSFCQLLLLSMLLHRSPWLSKLSGIPSPMLRMGVAAIAMGACVLMMKGLIPVTPTSGFSLKLLSLGALIATGILSYAVACVALGLRSWFRRPGVASQTKLPTGSENVG